MHTDIDENNIARRLRAAEDASEVPYEWTEFQRRRHRSTLTRVIERNRPAAIAAAVLATLLVTAFPFIHSTHKHRPVIAPPPSPIALSNPTDLQEQARTRALEGWLAALPQDHAIVRVGAHAAVSSLQDQIAALDELMTAERMEGAQPTRLDALERQRSQLVNSLAQVQYAEMLASANP
jgi:hypothetical protein